MRKILVLIGLPASGKSSFAKQFIAENPSYRRVNKDTIREMINFSNWTHKGESLVQNIRDSIIRQIIVDGYDVLIDDTNLQIGHINTFKCIADRMNVSITLKYFDVPIEECIARDTNRVGHVGETVIRRLWNDRTINVEEFK